MESITITSEQYLSGEFKVGIDRLMNILSAMGYKQPAASEPLSLNLVNVMHFIMTGFSRKLNQYLHHKIGMPTWIQSHATQLIINWAFVSASEVFGVHSKIGATDFTSSSTSVSSKIRLVRRLCVKAISLHNELINRETSKYFASANKDFESVELEASISISMSKAGTSIDYDSDDSAVLSGSLVIEDNDEESNSCAFQTYAIKVDRPYLGSDSASASVSLVNKLDVMQQLYLDAFNNGAEELEDSQLLTYITSDTI